MSWWSLSFRVRRFVKGSLWFLPVVGAAAGPVLGVLAVELDGSLLSDNAWTYSEGTASGVLSVIVGAMIGLLGFVVTISVLVVQSATGTLSPRFMWNWYQDPLQKIVLATFIGTLTYSYSLLRQITADEVPHNAVTLAGVLVALCLILLLVYLDRFTHVLRPVGTAEVIARQTLQVLEAFERNRNLRTSASVKGNGDRNPTARVRSTRGGTIQVLDTAGLVRLGRDADCAFTLMYAIGDYVPSGAVLIEVQGGASIPSEERLQHTIGLGRERTMEQDPAFGLRILVDVATRALSPGINDPTSAVEILDYIEDLLRVIGSRELGARGELVDDEGKVRVVIPLRRWEDFLDLGLSEIRQYGADSTQVCRRLRSLLEDLLEEVRPEHRPAVEAQLADLDATVAMISDPVTRAIAAGRDRQGIGSALGSVDGRDRPAPSHADA
jgi:uncharacterized membrane protein